MSTLYQVPKVIYNGNGKQTSFDFSFPAKSTTEVEVWVYLAATGFEGAIRLNEDFIFSEAPTENNGGTIVYPVKDGVPVLGENDKICIMRKSRLGNDYIFSNQTRLLPETVEDADDSLSLQIMDLARDLSMAVKSSPFDTRSPEERWNEMMKALKDAQAIINFINKEYLTWPEQIATEKQERIAQDSAILSTVAANKADCNSKISSLSASLEKEKQDRDAADSKFVEKSKLALAVTGIGILSTPTSVNITYDTKDASNGSTFESEKPLPVASETQHGIMPKEAYSTLTGLSSRVSLLEGGQAKSYALNLGAGPFSQEDYQLSWENAAGVEPGTVPPDGTKITNLDTNVDIQYFAAQGIWVERQISVPLATSTTTGVVKGSLVAGQVAVEQDGSMSLVGYDKIVSDVSNNASAVSQEQTRATSAENQISTTVESHIADSVRHVTNAERETWNNKYSKLDSGIPSDDLSVEVQSVLADAVTQTNGGTMSGKLTARSTTDSTNEVRNISFTDTDPGVGTSLASGDIIMVYE